MGLHLRVSARLALCTVAAASGPALAAPPAGLEALRGDALFQRLDANRNGRISRGEATRVKGFAAAFEAADDNRDGQLTPDEFIKARAIYDRTRAAQYLSDSIITAKVKAALLRSEGLDDHAIEVETYEGLVVLSGAVDREEQRVRASRVAASVSGVTGVKNVLEVGSAAAGRPLMAKDQDQPAQEGPRK
ncbi:MAG: BON domain-containing protein [Pseudomonadota bacterium]